MADHPNIAGVDYSWASIKIALRDKEYTDFAGIKWDESLTPGIIRGTGAFKRGRTKGEYDCNASFEMYTDEADAFEADLATINPSIGLVEFNVVANWSEDGPDGSDKVSTVLLVSCRIVKRSSDSAPGTDGSKRSYDLSVMRVEVNGNSLLSPTN